MSKTRGFELLSNVHDESLLPIRETSGAAGYDLRASESVTINPGETAIIKTGLKAYMQDGEVLLLIDRSSNYKKTGLVLINSVGVIDKDYYNNSGNEGHIMAQMKNISDTPTIITAGTRIVQGVFVPFLTVDGDNAAGKRVGGFGSTQA